MKANTHPVSLNRPAPCPPAPLRRDHCSVVGNPTSYGCRRVHRDGPEADGCDCFTQTRHFRHSCEICRLSVIIFPHLTFFLFFLQGLEVCGSPVMTAFSVRSCDSQVSIFAVADVMEKNGTSQSTTKSSLFQGLTCTSELFLRGKSCPNSRGVLILV